MFGIDFGGKLSDTVDSVAKGLDNLFTSDEEKAVLKNELEKIKIDAKHQSELLEMKVMQEFNSRTKEMEGTASDLKAIPIIGTFIIFMRGLQRPLWGYFVIYLDYMVFSNQYKLIEGSTTESAFWVINFLVLGFLFGERAVKNILPLVNEFLAKKKG